MATQHDPEKENLRREFADLPGQIPRRPDDDIKRDIESNLFYDDLVRSYGIKIDVADGVVTLSGTVSDEFERRRAVADAQKAPGVRQIIDDLQIAQATGRF